eukprot:Protomagalhaensia_sp_Gyna_25__2306@NODE_2265_length_1184_cov_14_985153_g1877_i0_p1_GENE_NODE_2265_length_1184_cov_14_985153_g1877_i0NODE_2265_length_1184_cov_14_985153_g1877_i0_p1_ORF_typecomplete_len265_score41_99_NODE_2265_length_1184_cov_14_985153_g1877_i03271121
MTMMQEALAGAGLDPAQAGQATHVTSNEAAAQQAAVPVEVRPKPPSDEELSRKLSESLDSLSRKSSAKKQQPVEASESPMPLVREVLATSGQNPENAGKAEIVDLRPEPQKAPTEKSDQHHKETETTTPTRRVDEPPSPSAKMESNQKPNDAGKDSATNAAPSSKPVHQVVSNVATKLDHAVKGVSEAMSGDKQSHTAEKMKPEAMKPSAPIGVASEQTPSVQTSVGARKPPLDVSPLMIFTDIRYWCATAVVVLVIWGVTRRR